MSSSMCFRACEGLAGGSGFLKSERSDVIGHCRPHLQS